MFFDRKLSNAELSNAILVCGQNQYKHVKLDPAKFDQEPPEIVIKYVISDLS